MIGSILSEVLGIAGDWIKSRREIQRAEVEADIAYVRRRQEADISWDQIMAEGSLKSWKDEFWTIVLAIPAVLAFLPFAQEWVVLGFDALETTPVWYQAMLGTAVAAAFGREQLISAIRDWTQQRQSGSSNP